MRMSATGFTGGSCGVDGQGCRFRRGQAARRRSSKGTAGPLLRSCRGEKGDMKVRLGMQGAADLAPRIRSANVGNNGFEAFACCVVESAGIFMHKPLDVRAGDSWRLGRSTERAL